MDKGLNVEMPADTALFEPLDADGYVSYNDSLSHHYPDTNVNLLMLQGLLDSNAPAEWADYASEFYTGMNQRLVFLPSAVHASATWPNKSPVRSGGPDCGYQIAASFYNSVGRNISTDCISDMEPPDFVGEQESTKQSALTYFGTEEL